MIEEKKSDYLITQLTFKDKSERVNFQLKWVFSIEIKNGDLFLFWLGRVMIYHFKHHGLYAPLLTYREAILTRKHGNWHNSHNNNWQSALHWIKKSYKSSVERGLSDIPFPTYHKLIELGLGKQLNILSDNWESIAGPAPIKGCYYTSTCF